jgi:hypothetical protein
MITLLLGEDHFEPVDVVTIEPAGYPGVRAIAIRPNHFLLAASTKSRAAGIQLLERQLIAIEGLEMEDEERWTAAEPWSTKEPYDHSNPRHFRSLPLELAIAIYDGLLMTDSEQPKITG